MIFETHAHYNDAQFDEDRDGLLAGLPAAGIAPVINVGDTIENSRASLALAEAYPHVYAAVGVHPGEIAGLSEESFAELSDLTAHPKAVAVGEIGLDYHWDKEPDVQRRQREWFARQLELAKETKLPVIIHSRDAAEDTLRIMKEHDAPELRGVIHCYSYSKELALEWVKLGYFIGVGGVVTFRNAKKLVATVEAVPLERIVLETDCPYMAPEPHRGRRNSSLYLPYVAEKIGQLRGIPAQEVIRVTRENAFALFPGVPRDA